MRNGILGQLHLDGQYRVFGLSYQMELI